MPSAIHQPNEQNLEETYADFAEILGMPKKRLIHQAMEAYLEELHDAASFIKGRNARLAGAKFTPLEEIKEKYAHED